MQFYITSYVKLHFYSLFYFESSEIYKQSRITISTVTLNLLYTSVHTSFGGDKTKKKKLSEVFVWCVYVCFIVQSRGTKNIGSIEKGMMMKWTDRSKCAHYLTRG